MLLLCKSITCPGFPWLCLFGWLVNACLMFIAPCPCVFLLENLLDDCWTMELNWWMLLLLVYAVVHDLWYNDDDMMLMNQVATLNPNSVQISSWWMCVWMILLLMINFHGHVACFVWFDDAELGWWSWNWIWNAACLMLVLIEFMMININDEVHDCC